VETNRELPSSREQNINENMVKNLWQIDQLRNQAMKKHIDEID